MVFKILSPLIIKKWSQEPTTEKALAACLAFDNIHVCGLALCIYQTVQKLSSNHSGQSVCGSHAGVRALHWSCFSTQPMTMYHRRHEGVMHLLWK